MANKKKITSIVIPPIGSGVLKVPMKLVCEGIQNGIVNFITKEKEEGIYLERIDICLENEEIKEQFECKWNRERKEEKKTFVPPSDDGNWTLVV